MILDPWARPILELFAETYPTSAHYRGGRILRLGSWEKRFPEITTNVDDKDGFLAAVEDLVHQGVLSVRWRRFRTGEEVDALYLDDPRKLYELLGAETPWDHRNALIAALAEPPWNDPRLEAIAERTRARLTAHHPLPVAKAEDLRDIGRLLLLTPRECSGSAIRAVSVRLFQDSKRLESLLPRADAFTIDVEGEKVSRRLGLSRKYAEVSFALYGTISWTRPTDSRDTFSRAAEPQAWHLCGEVVTLPGITAREIAGITLSRPSTSSAPWILTVENKECFYATAAAMRAAWGRTEGQGAEHGDPQTPPPSAVIYTPGHPGETVSAFVTAAGRSAATAMHFGDLDPEGLLILQEIAARTGLTVHPFLMDQDTYHRYRAFGRALSEHSLSRLSEITHPGLIPLAEEIGRFRVGVEQEVISFSL